MLPILQLNFLTQKILNSLCILVSTKVSKLIRTVCCSQQLLRLASFLVLVPLISDTGFYVIGSCYWVALQPFTESKFVEPDPFPLFPFINCTWATLIRADYCTWATWTCADYLLLMVAWYGAYLCCLLHDCSLLFNSLIRRYILPINRWPNNLLLCLTFLAHSLSSFYSILPC
jgi:hypothetical protein